MFGRETMPARGQVGHARRRAGCWRPSPSTSQRHRDKVDRRPLGGNAANTGMIFSRASPSLRVSTELVVAADPRVPDCHSAWGPNADRRGNSLNCLRKKGSNSEADLQPDF
jgi:hypothetical protein